MGKPLISVIVPVYNVESFLKRCIDSLLSQTYKNYEVLLIDDGSSDNSGNICDKYVEKDYRFQVFHKVNEGVSSARNLGLDKARGEWVCFVDSDDWVEECYLENFIEQLDESVDLVLSSFWKHWENNNQIEAVILPSIEIFGNYNLVKWLENTSSVHNGFIWHRMFNKRVIDNNRIRFYEDVSFAEDGIFFFQYMIHVNHFKLTSKIGYHYLIRGNSLTTLGHTYSVNVYVQILTKLLDLLCQFDIKDVYEQKRHLNFIKKYALRLSETWFLIRAKKDPLVMKESYFSMKVIIEKYRLDDVDDLSCSQRLLVNTLKLKDSVVKNLIIDIILKYRILSKKIIRYVKRVF